MKDAMNDMALRGGFQQGDSDYQKMADNQRMLLNEETKMLRDYMKEFKDDMMRM